MKLRKRNSSAVIEPLESRTLLSAWATVDNWQYVSGSAKLCRVGGMTADAGGNVYAAGYAVDSSGVGHGIIREETNGVWSTVADVANATFDGVITDSAGDVFAAGCKNPATTGAIPVGTASGNWIMAERAAGKTSFTIVNDPGSKILSFASAYGIAVDQAGNVFVVGTTEETQKQGPIKTATHWIVRKETVSQLLAGQDAFKTVDDYAIGTNQNRAYGVTNIATGPAAGLYVVGTGNGGWIVRKSTNAGSTWTTVDDVAYSGAYGVTGDASGNIYVVGSGNQEKWLVRKSSDGGTSWSTVDNLQTPEASDAYAVGIDPAGNVYVAGRVFSNQETTVDGIVRELPAGGSSWSTVDDLTNYPYDAFTVDSFGNAFAGGSDQSFFIRSLPAVPKNLTAVADSVNPSSQIDLSWSNSAGGDESGFAIYRSTDKVNFSLINTVSASSTSYSDTGLSSGTSYYYYVTAVLNSVDGSAPGSSAPSNTASATTSAAPMAAPAATAAVFSSTQISSVSNSTDFFHHRRHRGR